MELFDMKEPFSTKSLLTPAYRTGRSLCKREEFPLIKGGQGVVDPSLTKRGAGRFFN